MTRIDLISPNVMTFYYVVNIKIGLCLHQWLQLEDEMFLEGLPTNMHTWSELLHLPFGTVMPTVLSCSNW